MSILVELQLLEEALLSSAVRKSAERIRELLTDDFLEFGSSGRIYDREQILRQLSVEDAVDLTLENFEACYLSGTTALVTYRSIRRSKKAAVAYANRSSIWVFVDGRWRMRFHQGTPIHMAN